MCTGAAPQQRRKCRASFRGPAITIGG